MTAAANPIDPRFTPALALLGRTGAEQVQIRFQDEERPTVWIVAGCWPGGRWDAAAGIDPVIAAFRLCEQVLDGGTCTHCGRTTAFDADPVAAPLLRASEVAVCWYRWDPETVTFRRTCEGVHP